jgi:hypothetical protein
MYRTYLLTIPEIKETRKSTTKMKNRILAIETAPAATPPNPKIAAIIATIKNITAQRNITKRFKCETMCND